MDKTLIIAKLKELYNKRNERLVLNAKAAILETLKGLVAKGRLTDADLAKTDQNLGVADKLDGLKGCHVVIEAVFENLEVKQKLFGELEAVVAPTPSSPPTPRRSASPRSRAASNIAAASAACTISIPCR